MLSLNIKIESGTGLETVVEAQYGNQALLIIASK